MKGNDCLDPPVQEEWTRIMRLAMTFFNNEVLPCKDCRKIHWESISPRQINAPASNLLCDTYIEMKDDGPVNACVGGEYVSYFETSFEDIKKEVDANEAEARRTGTWTCNPTSESTAWRQRVDGEIREICEAEPTNLRDWSD